MKRNADEQAIEMMFEFEVADGEDLRQVAFNIMNIARENLENDGYLEPAVFLVRDQMVSVYRIAFQDEREKALAYGKVVQIAKQQKAQAIITLNDAFVGKPDDDPDSYYPGKLEAEGADEAIVLTVSGPAIPSWCLQLPYKNKADGVEFSELEEAKAQEMGLLPGWASERPQVH